jgi:hypothetical protein
MLLDAMKATSLAVAILSAGAVTARADAFTPFFLANVKAEGRSQFMTGVRGACGPQSHIAVGAVGADLTHNHVRFPCDAAIITTYDRKSIHTMVTFAEKAITRGVISFAGTMNLKSNILTVQRVYFAPGRPTYVDDGACKFFFSGRHMNGIFCGGKIDADGKRTVASIVFNAAPG